MGDETDHTYTYSFMLLRRRHISQNAGRQRIMFLFMILVVSSRLTEKSLLVGLVPFDKPVQQAVSQQ